jgi:hypothetical protein
MSEAGVIPRRSREIGRVRDNDGYEATIGLDAYGRVEIGHSSTALSVRLSQDQAEEFARLFVATCWEAAVPP